MARQKFWLAVSYEEPEEAGNFLDHFLWGLYYLLDGDIGSPLDGESGLIGTKISGEFREDTALKLFMRWEQSIKRLCRYD